MCRMKIKKLPNVLALHLKRFKFQEDVAKYIKLAYRVAFPMELRLFNTVDDAEDPDRLYELFAIVVHIGKYVQVAYRDLLHRRSHAVWLLQWSLPRTLRDPRQGEGGLDTI